MRILSMVIVAVLLSGCGRAEPTLVGGKPVDYWVQAMHDSDVKLRKKAAFKLGNVGPTDPAALPALLDGLKDDDAGVRSAVILALMKFGPEAREAIPVLTAMQKHDRDKQVRCHAGKALAKLQSGD
jgi:HEAT repeat protein